MEGAPRLLRAGFVGRAHGLDGSVHVARVVAAVFGGLDIGDEVLVAGRPRRIERLAGHAGRPIVRFDGDDTREDAEALAGAEIVAERAVELEEDEWWAEDLEGCAVRDGGVAVGTVSALLGLPSCDVLEVARDAGGPALLVPLIRDAVREVDLDRRVIDVDLRFLGEDA